MISTPASGPKPLFSPQKLLGMLQDAALVTMAILFVYVHGKHALDGHWTSIPFALQQGLLAAIFLTRRRTIASSSRPADWVVASMGSWLPLAMQLHETPDSAIRIAGFVMQSIGALMATVGIWALGRSFGVVAANRGLKTHGPYGIVRHPVYACHIITDVGFVIANFYWINVVLIAVIVIAQVLRIRAEERVLTSSGPYTEYKAKVRYRLLPGVF